MNPEYLGLLADIRQNAADDTPRLIMADWLADNGQPERGRFIRCQVEASRVRRVLAEPYPHSECSPLSASWCPVCGDCVCRYPEDRMDDAACPLHAPTSRHGGDESIRLVGRLADEDARMLLRSHAFVWFGGAVPWSEPLGYGWVARCWELTDRGFLASVSLPLAAAIERLPGIVAKHPVTRVEISDLVITNEDYLGGPNVYVEQQMAATPARQSFAIWTHVCVAAEVGLLSPLPRVIYFRGAEAAKITVSRAILRWSDRVNESGMNQPASAG